MGSRWAVCLLTLVDLRGSVSSTFSNDKTAETENNLVVAKGQGKRSGWGQVPTHRGSNTDFFCDEGTVVHLDCGGGYVNL